MSNIGAYELTPKEAATYTNRLNELLRQLSPTVRLNSEEEWEDGLKQEDATFFVAKDNEKKPPDDVVGMSYIFFRWRGEGWYAGIHTVVRDEKYKGQHIGSLLTLMMIFKARIRAQQLKRPISIELTCKPSRETANKMYQEFGFDLVAKAIPDRDPKTRKVRRDATGKTVYKGTNLYRMKV